MNAAGVLVTLILVLGTVFPRRGTAVLFVMASVCYITQGEQTVVMGFHFTANRIVLLAGFMRVLLRGDLRAVKFNRIDWALVLFAATSTIIPYLRVGTTEELNYQVGAAYNILLAYFTFRGLVTSWEEFEELLPKIAVFIMPMGILMLMETETGHSAFTFFGGLPELDPDRSGHFRATGAFRGAHCAGGFGASLIPLFACLYATKPQRRLLAAGAIIAATAITYSSNCSGPLMSYLSSWVGLAFWPAREQMRRVRWCLVIGLFVLSLVMNSPIWYVMAKISAITGGDGWSRSYLMDQCFKHFSDWWTMGTSDTSAWAATTMAWGGADLCNAYVSAAAAGGLSALVSFILLLVFCFGNLGSARKAASLDPSKNQEIFWCMGCVLFSHVMVLFSVTYWDQMSTIWWGTIAMIASISSSSFRTAPAVEGLEETDEPGNPDFAAAVSSETGLTGEA